MEAAVLEKAPVFSIQDSIIDEFERDYMVLAVDDPSDKQAIAVVTEAWRTVRAARLAAEKCHKELKEESLRYSQACDAELRRIKGRILPVENHLHYQKDAAKREAERIAKEAEEKRQAKIAERFNLMRAADAMLEPGEAGKLSDAEFDVRLAEAQNAQRERAEQAAREAEERRLADERLKAEREELDRQRAAQEAEQKRLAEEKAKLDAAAAEARRTEELAKAREEAATRAIADEKARIEREAAEAKAKADQEAAEKARREAAAPDREKLVAFEKQLAGMVCPELSEANRGLEAKVNKAVDVAIGAIERMRESLD